MTRFVLFALMLLIGSCSAAEEVVTVKNFENRCIFLILLITVYVGGFVLVIHKFHFVQSSNNNFSKKVGQLGHLSATLADTRALAEMSRTSQKRQEIFWRTDVTPAALGEQLVETLALASATLGRH